MLVAAAIAGCTTIKIDLPPITDSATGERHDGKVVWRDLLTNTPEESRRFYGELFGWEFERPATVLGIGGDDAYMLIRHNGRLIGGIVDTNSFRPGENISQWVTTISIQDIDAAVERVTVRGGTIMTSPTSIGSRGRIAVAEDPGGALFAMIRTNEGDPADQAPDYDGWLWDELWTGDVDAATGFYREVFGFDFTDHDIDATDSQYRVLSIDDTPRAGILTMPFEGERPVWVNYLRVRNPSAITARVAQLGGRVLLDAQERSVGGTVALVAGPSGAGIALQTWPLDEGGNDAEK